MKDAYACASVVISRAGSNTVCELLALKKPMLLIPYPKEASRGDQILNAASYEKRGLARVLPQEQMTTDTLYQAILELVRDGDSLRAALRDAPPADGTMAVLGLIHEIQK